MVAVDPKDGRPGPTREQLVNSLSILRQLKHTYVVQQKITEAMIRDVSTERCRRVVVSAHDTATKYLQVVSVLLSEHRQLLDDYLAGIKLLGGDDDTGGTEEAPSNR